VGPAKLQVLRVVPIPLMPCSTAGFYAAGLVWLVGALGDSVAAVLGTAEGVLWMCAPAVNNSHARV